LTPEPPSSGSNERSSSPFAGPDLKFFVKDHLGNVRVAYRPLYEPDSLNGPCVLSFEVVSVMDFFPYGKILRSPPIPIGVAEGPERVQSTGHERDSESDWDYRGARYYSADYGRFLSPDPLGAFFPQWSPYNYVLGNPVSLIDPTGLYPKGGGDDNTAWIDDNGEVNTRLNTVTITGTTKEYEEKVVNAVGRLLLAPAAEEDNGLAWWEVGVMVFQPMMHLSYESSQDAFATFAGKDFSGNDRNQWTSGAYTALNVLPVGVVGRAGRTATNTIVYLSRNGEGVVQYIGITKNLVARSAAHLRQKGIVIEELITGLSRADARAVEQVLIERFSLGKSGGTLMNLINSIARSNPKYEGAIKRGMEILKEKNITY
jgi:RHS repeat-associated protein